MSELEPSPTSPTHQKVHIHACTTCARRKVKCDRKQPCSNCVRVRAKCEVQNVLPPRRRRGTGTRTASTQPQSLRSLRSLHGADELLLARVRRYEGVFRRMGVDPDAVDVDDDVPLVAQESRTSRCDAEDTGVGTGMLVAKEGRSLYLNRDLWRNMKDELLDADDILPERPKAGSAGLEDEEHDESLFFSGSATRRSLVDLHPSPFHIFKLWQVFLENVNPLSKIVHVPALQQRILDASGDLRAVSAELEALMFAIYCASLRSLGDDEVVKMFGETRFKLFARYRKGAQRALLNAGFLGTTDMMVLQALVIFILSVRLVCDGHTLWSLSGIAVRIAQRIGLHRDGTKLGLSVFETEMRRRLWWQIVIVDATIGHASGSVLPVAQLADARMPLNVNDSDLDPDMKESPIESTGPTEMIFCLLRYEVGRWLQRYAASSGSGAFDSYWESVTGPSIPMEEKDRRLQELESILQEKVTSCCDPSIGLHLMTSTVSKSVMLSLHFSAHHPRFYQEKGESPTQAEKDRLFSACMGVAEYGHILRTSDKTKRYIWHVDYHFPWPTHIYLLSELRHRTLTDETARAWQLVDITCTQPFKQLLGSKVKVPLHFAIANLAIKAWAAHLAECERRQMPSLPQPRSIDVFWRLMQQLKSTPSGESFLLHPVAQEINKSPTIAPDLVQGPATKDTGQPSDTTLSSTVENGSGSTNVDFTTLMDLDALGGDIPVDWNHWDELLQQFQQQQQERDGETFKGLFK